MRAELRLKGKVVGRALMLPLKARQVLLTDRNRNRAKAYVANGVEAFLFAACMVGKGPRGFHTDSGHQKNLFAAITAPTRLASLWLA